MMAKKGRLSMFRPGNGIGWILSAGAESGPAMVVRSTSRVSPFAERYSWVIRYFMPMPSSSASSISMNSMGTRRMVIADSVTTAAAGFYEAKVDRSVSPSSAIVLTERGDTVTQNAIMAAARHDGVTVIRNASPNYMVQDVCFFLGKLGVQIEGVGTTTLTIHGRPTINEDVEFYPSEDPIEAMSLLAAAVVTESAITIRRVPIEFMEIELALLEGMGMKYLMTQEYRSANGLTRLVDLTTIAGPLSAPADKIHPLPFPGLNIDNLPFFAIIAASATGTTMIHDWVYDNRAIYLTELTKVGVKVQLLDPHRVLITGPTRWRAAEVICPPALRPAVVILVAMLAAPGTSVLRNVYVINRGYEDLATRLNALGATIETFRDI